MASPRKPSKRSTKRSEEITRRKANEKWFKEQIYARDHAECVVCHTTTRLQVHHLLIQSRHKALRYTTENGILLCNGHHRFLAHGDSLAFFCWMSNNRPDQLKWAMTQLEANG